MGFKIVTEAIFPLAGGPFEPLLWVIPCQMKENFPLLINLVLPAARHIRRTTRPEMRWAFGLLILEKGEEEI